MFALNALRDVLITANITQKQTVTQLPATHHSHIADIVYNFMPKDIWSLSAGLIIGSAATFILQKYYRIRPVNHPFEVRLVNLHRE